jgi:hypothetical protein
MGIHVVCLTYNGNIYSWGVNDHGALCRSTNAKDETLKNADTSFDDSEAEADLFLNEEESTPSLVEGIPEGTRIVKLLLVIALHSPLQIPDLYMDGERSEYVILALMFACEVLI